MAKFCSECGNNTENDKKFCSGCWYNLSQDLDKNEDTWSSKWSKKEKKSIPDTNETIRNSSYNVSPNSISRSLPGWQILVKDEEIIRNDEFVSSLSTFYIKSGFAVTNKRFISNYPNIVMGIFPMGISNTTFTLKQISWVQIDISYKIFRMILGIIIWFIWLWTIDEAGVLFLIAGILLFGSWIQTGIKIVTSWGVTFCPVIFWEKDKATILVQELNRSIAENV